MVVLILPILAKVLPKYYNSQNYLMALIDSHNLGIFSMGIKVNIMGIFGHKFIQQICLQNLKKLDYLTKILEEDINSKFLRLEVQEIHLKV